jgi:hypothetical protein
MRLKSRRSCKLIYKNLVPYLTGNALRIRYKAQPVNAVYGNSRCLLWELSYTKHTDTLWWQNAQFWMLRVSTSSYKFKGLKSCYISAIRLQNLMHFLRKSWSHLQRSPEDVEQFLRKSRSPLQRTPADVEQFLSKSSLTCRVPLKTSCSFKASSISPAATPWRREVPKQVQSHLQRPPEDVEQFLSKSNLTCSDPLKTWSS